MYVPPLFRTDRAACLAFAATRGFGLVVAIDRGRPVASSLPFYLSYLDDGTPCAAFHVARGNPLVALAAEGGSWLIAVNGADAYVSPDWYQSPDQVPTWLYETVHLSGPARLMRPEGLREHLDQLSETFERQLAPKPIWSADKVAPARREALMKAIVGIEVDIETVEGSAKLNQNKSDADFASVVTQLRCNDRAMNHEIATRMVALRPQLTYE